MAPRAGQRRRAAALVLSPLARQIAALGLALCAVALSLAYPLRNYLQQQAAEQAAVAQQHQLEDQIADLKAQEAALKDPAYIKAEAKRRLQYVTPGDTVYVVKVPATDAPSPSDPSADTDQADTDQADTDQQAGTADGNGTAANGGASGADGQDAGGDGGSAASVAGSGGGEPWYASMWDTLNGSGGDAVAPAP